MTSNNGNDQRTHGQRTAGYMAAYAELLLGSPGRFDEFREHVNLVLSGSEPRIEVLLQMTEQVRSTGRPVIWIHHGHEVPEIPTIGLVAPIAGGTHIIENCMLLKRPGDDRAMLVPDSFQQGSYRFGDTVQLQHISKAPARSFDHAKSTMRETYARLYAIESEQAGRGEVFEEPTLARAA